MKASTVSASQAIAWARRTWKNREVFVSFGSGPLVAIGYVDHRGKHVPFWGSTFRAAVAKAKAAVR